MRNLVSIFLQILGVGCLGHFIGLFFKKVVGKEPAK